MGSKRKISLKKLMQLGLGLVRVGLGFGLMLLASALASSTSGLVNIPVNRLKAKVIRPNKYRCTKYIILFNTTNPSNINGLKILNDKILRILLNRSRRTHIIDLYTCYSTIPINLLHKYQILLFVHKFAHHSNRLPLVFASYFTQNKLIHQHGTRDKCDFI